MKIKHILGALAFTMSTTAFAVEPAPAPNKECCCKKDAHGKMACCKDKAEQTGDDHTGHSEGGSGHQ